MKALSYNAMYRGKLKEITAKIKAGKNNKKVTGRRWKNDEMVCFCPFHRCFWALFLTLLSSVHPWCRCREQVCAAAGNRGGHRWEWDERLRSFYVHSALDNISFAVCFRIGKEILMQEFPNSCGKGGNFIWSSVSVITMTSSLDNRARPSFLIRYNGAIILPSASTLHLERHERILSKV